MKKKSTRRKLPSRTEFRKRHPHLYYLMAGVGVILFWRGIWGILDKYLFPAYELPSLLFSVCLGLFLLYIDDFKLEELI